ncbi:MAG TPA: glycerophosphodiester phosphodiesterase [Thermodesulfobacteriota bacterium]|nr:glycerophosphodiester phosphodiesterase [Thermodesulfobacteriota bacterium]
MIGKCENRIRRKTTKKWKGGARIADKLIIAHRGALGYAKENTIESFEKAVALGADMIEFDVRRTKDNVLIVFHDERIQDKPVNDLVYEEIRQIARNQGFDLPTVEEVLKWSRGRIGLDVELKEEDHEKKLAELLIRYLKDDQFVITSFNESSLRIIKDDYPDIRVGLLLGKSDAPSWARISEYFPMKRCKKAKADFLVAHFKLLRFGFLERARREHKSVFVWTANDEETIWKLLNDERICAIITDRPDLAVLLRKKLVT